LQTGQEVLALQGLTSAVRSVCFSPDGKRLASGSGYLSPGEVKVWDLQTGQEVLALQVHAEEVSSVCFSPDGKRLATGSDNTAKVWDARTGQEVLALKGQTGFVTSVCFSPDGKRLAGGCGDFSIRGKLGEVKVWDARTGQEVLALKGHTGVVTSVAFSPDGKRIASGSSEVKVWDAQTGQEVLALKGGGGSVCFSPDGNRIASDSGDHTVKVWEAQTGQEVLALKGHAGNVYSVAFSPDSQRITSLARDATKSEAKTWDLVTGMAIEPSTDPLPDGQRTALSPDGQTRAWINGDRVQVLRLSHLPEQEKEEREMQTAWHWRQAIEAANARQWFAAVFHLDRLLRNDPENPEAHRRRGDARAEQGQWLPAAADFAAASERQRDNARHRRQHAWTLLAAGDPQGYRRTCAWMLKDLGDKPTASTVTAIALTSTLTADSGIDPRRLVELAEQAVSSDRKSAAYQETLGAALYRAGRYDDAAKRLAEAVELHGNGGTAWTKLFLAMAHHRAGHAEEARRRLAEYDRRGWTARGAGMLGAAGLSPLPAVTWLAVPPAEMPDPDGGSLPWEERLVRRLLRREVEQLLKEPPAGK
jgi:WD40 repeat protein/Flp pilus assembly protein TadD